ncbi:transposase, IS608 family protein [Kalymmatonema gypsitolerans NIES-4073]|nr:transposase, IS608 family protein [Scytonema sp. NIES-4073]
MPREITPSLRHGLRPTFVVEYPAIVDSKAQKELDASFNAGLRLLNTVQNEALIRIEMVRQSSAWADAKKLPKTITKKGKPTKNPERAKAFEAVKKAYRFTEFELQDYATLVAKRSKWIWEKLDSQSIQKIATRVFNAVNKILTGRALKVRFKNNRSFSSMEGKQIGTGIRVDKKMQMFVWGKLRCPLIIDWDDPCQKHGWDSKWKYARIIRRELNGKTRWFVQIVCEGIPYQGRENTQPLDAKVSIDLNISNVAYFSFKKAGLKPFADKVPTFEKEIKVIQRSQDRSRRINNPDNFNSNDIVFKGKKKGRKVKRKGQIKRGKKLHWNNSKNYRRLLHKRRELERRKTAYARSQNRALANDILRNGGKHLNLEDVSVKGWQRRYGKAISAKSPGFFQSELLRKAESAGGVVNKYSTQKTACSQTHLDGSRVKKKLSERIHYDQTGIVMHRDLFSAYLGLFVHQDGYLSVEDAFRQYPGSEPILSAAWAEFQKRSSDKARPSPRSS